MKKFLSAILCSVSSVALAQYTGDVSSVTQTTITNLLNYGSATVKSINGVVKCNGDNPCSVASASDLAAAIGILNSESIYSICPSVLTNTDIAACLQTFANRPTLMNNLFLPCGSYTYSAMVTTSHPINIIGQGSCSYVKSVIPSGSPTQPFMDLVAGSEYSSLNSFLIDGNEFTLPHIAPTLKTGNLIMGALVVIESDKTQLINMNGQNSWDNCFIYSTLSNAGTITAGSPFDNSYHRIRTTNCGLPSTKGAGVDIGSASHFNGNDLIDNFSMAALIVDTGAGAQGAFVNVLSYNSRFNAATPGGHNYSFYIAGANSQFINLQALNSSDRGFWIDAPANDDALVNITCKATVGSCMLYKAGPNNSITNFIIDSAGYGKTSGTVDAILLDNTYAQITAALFNNVQFAHTFNMMRYGFANQGGPYGIFGVVANADYGGVTAKTDPSLVGSTSFLVGSTCSGAPTASFTSYQGMITHC